MSTSATDVNRPESIDGYDYGSPEVARSPVTLEELSRLRATVGLTAEDEKALRRAAELLGPQAEAIVDAWREIVGQQPHLAAYSAHADGSPYPEYSAASRPRFVRWVIDACTRPLDQAWLDYQHEIGLRHTRAKKNTTDGVVSAEHIPLRYVLAFAASVVIVTRRFLETSCSGPQELERMHSAWTKAVILHVTLWSRAYVDPEAW